jgi:hypothetical protein
MAGQLVPVSIIWLQIEDAVIRKFLPDQVFEYLCCNWRAFKRPKRILHKPHRAVILKINLITRFYD